MIAFSSASRSKMQLKGSSARVAIFPIERLSLVSMATAVLLELRSLLLHTLEFTETSLSCSSGKVSSGLRSLLPSLQQSLQLLCLHRA